MRAALSKRVRFDVFKRDAFTCQYCGAHPPQAILHVDHINPVALGGGNDPDNLVTACAGCNLGKSAKPLDCVPASLAARAEEVAEREAQIAGYAAVIEAARKRVEADAWTIAVVLNHRAADGYPRDRLNSIKRFLQDLHVGDLLEAADAAVLRFPHAEARAFRYFCGICWKRIRPEVAQ